MKKAQWVSLIIACCTAIGSQAGALREVLSATAVTWVLLITNVLSAALPSLLQRSDDNEM